MADNRVDVLLRIASELSGSSETLSFLNSVAQAVTGVAAGFGAIEAVKGALNITKEATEMATQIKAVAAASNLSTDMLQVLTIAGSDYGVTQEQISRGAITLRESLEKAAIDGASPLNGALATLNLTARGLQALSVQEQFEIIGERIGAATDKEAAFNAGMELLGTKNAPHLIDFLKQLGTQGIDKVGAAVSAIVLTPAQLDTLDQAGSKLERIWKYIELMGAKGVSHVADAVAPSLQKQMADLDKFSDAVSDDPKTKADAAGGISDQRLKIASELLQAGGEENVRLAKEQMDKVEQVIESDGVNLYNKLRDRYGVLVEQYRAATAEIDQRKGKTAEEEGKMSAADSQANIDTAGAAGAAYNAKVELDQKGAIAKLIQRVQAATDKQNDSLEHEAQKYRDLANPQQKYLDEMFMVNALLQRGMLTSDEAAKAIDNLKSLMGDELGKAIRSTNDALTGFERQLSIVADDPFLNDMQKREQRIALLKQENEAIERQIEYLKKFAAEHPGTNSKEINSQTQKLGEQHTRNANEMGKPNPQNMSVGDTVLADVVSLQNKIQPPAQAIGNTLANSIGAGFDSATTNLTRFTEGLESPKKAILAIGQSIEDSIIGGIIKMGVQWVEQQALMAIFGKSMQTASSAYTLAQNTALAAGISAVMVGPATLATIATVGAAADMAPIEMATAMASAAPLAAFSLGGYTGDVDTSQIAGMVHGQEYVINASATAKLGTGLLSAMNAAPDSFADMARTDAVPRVPGGGNPFQPYAAAAQKRQRTVLVDGRDSNVLSRLKSDPNWDTEFQAASGRNAGAIGLPR